MPYTISPLLKAENVHYIAYCNTFDKSSGEQMFYHCEFSYTNSISKDWKITNLDKFHISKGNQ